MLVRSELLIGLVFWGLFFVFDFSLGFFIVIVQCLMCPMLPVSLKKLFTLSVFVAFIQSIKYSSIDSRIWRLLAEVRRAIRLRAEARFVLIVENPNVTVKYD